MKAYASTIALAALSATLLACGGGGSSYTPAPGELAPWEWEAGICSFDSREAKAQAEREGAQCSISMINNSVNDRAWPPVSWPSTPVLWRAR